MFPLKFIEKIHNYEITLDEARNYQTVLSILINKINNDCNPRIPKKAKEKNNVLESAIKILDARKNIIDSFEKGTFPYKGNVFKTKKKESEDESEENKLEEIKYDYKKHIECIENKSKSINFDLFKDYFNLVVPSSLGKKLFKTKDKKKNSEFLEKIKSRWGNLKDETEKMS